MEKIENVNQTLRDENQKLTLTNENKNTIIDALQRKILVIKDQLKKRLPTPFTVLPQRNPKFLDPEQFGGIRDELELFKFNFKTKFQTNPSFKPMVIGILPKKKAQLRFFAFQKFRPKPNPP